MCPFTFPTYKTSKTFQRKAGVGTQCARTHSLCFKEQPALSGAAVRHKPGEGEAMQFESRELHLPGPRHAASAMPRGFHLITSGAAGSPKPTRREGHGGSLSFPERHFLPLESVKNFATGEGTERPFHEKLVNNFSLLYELSQTIKCWQDWQTGKSC